MNERPADRLAIAVAQLSPVVGDISGNLERARKARLVAARDGADLVAFSELFIAGYPPEDLVLKPAFQAACRAAIETLARETADGGPGVLIGTPWVEDNNLYNAYALLAAGRIAAIRFKVNLPNYGVFDEKRVFATGPVPGPVSFRGVRFGLPICEDTWTEFRRLRECGRVSGRNRCRNFAGAERFALLARQERCPPQCIRGACHRIRPATALHQSVRRPGRTCFRWRLVCAQYRPVARLPAPGVCRGRGHDALVAHRIRLALRAGAAGGATCGRQCRLHRLHDRPARLRREKWFPRNRARAFRRH